MPVRHCSHARLIRDLLACLPLTLAAFAPLMPRVGQAVEAPPVPSAQQEYWARFADNDWDAAIASAEQLVAAARPATAQTGLQLSEALALLGSAQLRKGNLVAAEAAFREGLQLAERYGGRSSRALIEPLRGLGYTLATEGRHEEAIPYMDRALLLSRRAAGLFDPSQEGLLRQLATSLVAVGAAPEGERHMTYLKRLGEQAYGSGDARMIPLLCAIGDWYMEVAQTDIARQNYRAAIDVAERLGENNVAIVAPLRALAASFPREIMLSFFGIPTRYEKLSNLDPNAHVSAEPMNPRYMSAEGERALQRALNVLQANPQGSEQTMVETLVQAGDWFVMKQQWNRALPIYELAAQRLAKLSAEQRAAIGGDALLGFPAQIFYPTPALATRNLTRPPQETEDRFVQVEFTVKPDSSVADVRVVDQDSGDRRVSQVVEAMRSARYRPKFVDGQPVETQAVSYRQIFKVRRSASDAE